MGWSVRAEIDALRSLDDAHVRIESADLLHVIYTGWLRVCLHLDRDTYPTQQPLAFVESEPGAPTDGASVEVRGGGGGEPPPRARARLPDSHRACAAPARCAPARPPSAVRPASALHAVRRAPRACRR